MNKFERGRDIHEALEIGSHAAAINVDGLAYLRPDKGMCTFSKKACHEYFQVAQRGNRYKPYPCYIIVGGKKHRIEKYIGRLLKYDNKLYSIPK